jgi:hypothetical protein
MMIRAEQDLAYEKSMAIDNKLNQIKLDEERVKLEQDNAQIRDHNIRIQIMEAAVQMLNPTPPINYVGEQTIIKLRLPNGVNVYRTFQSNTPVTQLFVFLYTIPEINEHVCTHSFGICDRLNMHHFNLCGLMEFDQTTTFIQLNLVGKHAFIVTQNEYNDSVMRFFQTKNNVASIQKNVVPKPNVTPIIIDLTQEEDD